MSEVNLDHVKKIDEIVEKYIAPLSPERRIQVLVYFYQHLLQLDVSDKETAIKKAITKEDHEIELDPIIHFLLFLEQKMKNTENNLEKIEYKISFNSLAEYLLNGEYKKSI